MALISCLQKVYFANLTAVIAVSSCPAAARHAAATRAVGDAVRRYIGRVATLATRPTTCAACALACPTRGRARHACPS